MKSNDCIQEIGSTGRCSLGTLHCDLIHDGLPGGHLPCEPNLSPGVSEGGIAGTSATEGHRAESRAQITITWNLDGMLAVNGPMEDEALFDWMMKKAGESAAMWRSQQATQISVAPVPPALTFKQRLKQLTRRR